MRRSWCWALLLAAIFTRFFYLDNKPIHFDESINGWFLLQMKTLGFYKYDPHNYHGPLYFYSLQVWTALFGESLVVMRSLATLFSFAAVVFFIRRSFWTAVFILISPGLIFYGRSAIHEMPFVFSQILFFVGLYEYQKEQRLSSLWWALLGFLGMASLKETFLMTGFATVLAISLCFPWKSFVKDMWGPMRVPILFVVLSLALLFSGFAKNLVGILDFFRAFTFWSATGIESGHNKSFWYWLEMAAQAEPLLIFAGLIAIYGLFNKKYRTLSIFSLCGWLLYSIIPYKTPWCMISWSWPFYYLLGEYFKDLKTFSVRLRISIYSVTVILGLVGIYNIWSTAFRTPIAMEHPFVYVNSSYDFKRIDDRIQNVLQERPELKNEIIQVSMDETWPIPWTLHESRGLRYDRFNDLIHPNALIYFCELGESILLDKDVAANYISLTMPFRQFGRTVRICLRKDVFKEPL